MISKHFKLDLEEYRKQFIGPVIKNEKKPSKLRVMSEWSWDLGLIAFGKMDKS